MVDLLEPLGFGETLLVHPGMLGSYEVEQGAVSLNVALLDQRVRRRSPPRRSKSVPVAPRFASSA